MHGSNRTKELRPAPAKTYRRAVIWTLLAGFSQVGGCVADVGSEPEADSAPGTATPSSDAEPGPLYARITDASRDPGRGAWREVPPWRVREECGLSPAALRRADRELNAPYAIIRHGKLCHSFRARSMWPEEAWSTTKALGAVTLAALMHETRDLPVAGPQTGPFSDLDRVDSWLSDFSYNPEAQVAHVLGMVAHNEDLSFGHRAMEYDGFGNVQIDTLGDVVNRVVQQDESRLGANLEEFVQRYMFEPLGMQASSWGLGLPDKTLAFTWNTTVLDMARLGLLLLNDGVWNGARILDQDFVHRMTHPAFEDANTGWGYMLWLNASSNHHQGGLDGAASDQRQQEATLPGACAPVAVHAAYPNPISDAPDCGYEPPSTCEKTYDVGIYQAAGLFGQIIQVHPGLDMVLVGKNLTGFADIAGLTGSKLLWDAVRPAVVEADPAFQGDEQAFCEAYGANAYAPDL